MRSARSGSSLMAKMPRLVRGHQAVVERELVGEVAALGHLDRVDLADEVGDGGVGRGQLLAVAGVAVHPVDRRVVALLGDQLAGVAGHRRVRVVVDLAAGDDGHPLVEQLGERPDHAGLGLAPLAQEDHVVAGEEGVLELRQDGVLVAEHRVDQRLAGPDPGDGVAPDLGPSPGPTPTRSLAVDRSWLADSTWSEATAVLDCDRPPESRAIAWLQPTRTGDAEARVASAAMDLGGTWRAAIGRRGPPPHVARRPTTTHDWDPVTVPGHWRSDRRLRRLRRPAALPHPLRARRPGADDERWWLRFDGLFYQGDVWLDGAYVGDTEGYFFPHTFEVTEALAAADRAHARASRSPATRPATSRPSATSPASFQHAGCSTRRGTPAASGARSRLERTGPVRIRHLRVLCRDAPSAWPPWRSAPCSTPPTAVRGARSRSTRGRRGARRAARLAAGENQVEWTLGIDDPTLWWPHALGDQPLHDVAVEVTPRRRRRATATDETPTATVTPVEPPGQPPHRPARGAPARLGAARQRRAPLPEGRQPGPDAHAPRRGHREDLRGDVELAKAANLDFLRLHAHVSRPELYDAADEAGMLIWQDFPLHRGYARSIRKQAQRQAREAVDLLAHHPSVAIWCAHDEPFTSTRARPPARRRHHPRPLRAGPGAAVLEPDRSSTAR